MPDSVSWSVRAMTSKPAAAWAPTTSHGGSSPSLKIVCRCRFARPFETSAKVANSMGYASRVITVGAYS